MSQACAGGATVPTAARSRHAAAALPPPRRDVIAQGPPPLCQRPLARARRGLLKVPRCAALPAPTTPGARAPLEAAVLAAAAALDNPIFPGGAASEEDAARAALDSMLEELEAASPVAAPLAEGPTRAVLCGRWRLLYASAGTVVTASKLGSLIRSLSVLPFVGLEGVEQELEDLDGAIVCRNAADFGLGLFGSWRVVIFGSWAPTTPSLAAVAFDSYSLQMQKVLGVPVPAPTIRIPVPAAARRVAEFSTTYLSAGVRISRGRSRNAFLFVRED